MSVLNAILLPGGEIKDVAPAILVHVLLQKGNPTEAVVKILNETCRGLPLLVSSDHDVSLADVPMNNAIHVRVVVSLEGGKRVCELARTTDSILMTYRR